MFGGQLASSYSADEWPDGRMSICCRQIGFAGHVIAAVTAAAAAAASASDTRMTDG